MRRLLPTIALFALGILVLTAFRIVLLRERADDLESLTRAGFAELFTRGFRLDAIVVAALCLPLALAYALAPARWLRGMKRPATLWCGAVFLLLTGAATAELYFFRYYDFRFNYLVFEHGADAEVAGTIARSYPLVTIGAIVAALTALATLAWRKLACLRASRAWPTGRAGILLAIPVLAFLLRGTFDHRALNPTYAAFCDNRVANEIAGNGVLNLAHEWAQRSKERYVGLADVLRLLPDERAVATAREHLAPTGRFVDGADNPVAREVGSPASTGPKNVIVVVLESYTARLVGHLGGKPALTPHLDALARESLVLNHCFATGERTIQGLEAVLCSFPPLPGVGVVRRPEAKHGFDTLALVLKQRRYATRFLYGGQGIFDHMSAFFLANGYDEFIEEPDFDDGTFRGEWGWCDEDVYRRADREARALHAQGVPFLVTVLTVSLHAPWEYPDGVIEELPRDVDVPKGFEYEELNTFLYADAAIGRFMALAKQAPYYDDTVFAFVGDHGVHLRGRDLLPADEYRVAALIHAPRHVAPARIDGVTSQLDIAPTLLGILGGTWRSTFFGRDLRQRKPDEEGTALLVYGKRRFGYLHGPRLTLLSNVDEHAAFLNEPPGWRWRPVPFGAEQNHDAIVATSLLQVAESLLERGRYRALSEAGTDELLRR